MERLVLPDLTGSALTRSFGAFGAQLETSKSAFSRDSTPNLAQQTAANILDAQVGDITHATLIDQIRLLAMAFVDPVLHPPFAALAAPVESSARPVANIKANKARKRALYKTLAETVMHRRAQYTNTFVDLQLANSADKEESTGVKKLHAVRQNVKTSHMILLFKEDVAWQMQQTQLPV